MGANTRQPGLTHRRRGRTLPPVAFVSRRAWCRESGPPRSREASGSNPWSPARTNLQILSHGKRAQVRECGRAGHAGGWDAIGRSCPKRVRDAPGASPIPRREPDHSRKADRVQGPSGSINARWRREPPGGDTEEPEADPLRGSAAQKADREELNDERGVKPLPVNDSRDGRRSGQARSGWVRRRFCILPPEIGPVPGPETLPGREPRDMPGEWGRPYAFRPRDCCGEGQD